MIIDATKPLEGIVCSKGIGIGYVYKIKEHSVKEDSSSVDHEFESERLKKAIEEYKRYNEALADRVLNTLGSHDADIIKAQSLIIEDEELNSLLYKFIRNGKKAECAVWDVFKLFSDMFLASDDPLFKQKCSDIEDVKNSLLSFLTGESEKTNFTEKCVLISKNIAPSVMSALDNGKVLAVVSEYGNESSHSAILARALKVPMVSGIEGIYDAVENGTEILVDALDGRVIIAPSDDDKSIFNKKNDSYLKSKSELDSFIGKSTSFTDGSSFKIMCNVTGLTDIRRVFDNDGDGIGLFRTEFLFMNSETPPSEDYQFEIYKKVAESLGEKEVVIRILDAGGDKGIDYLDIQTEDNPFLGLRGIRFCLREKEVLKTQLRAILRASVYGNISILIPMVTDLSEIKDFKIALKECEKELKSEGKDIKDNIRFGCMIETPGAVMIAEELAQEADFFSIGTNDLIQYTMCADRGNPKVSYLYSAYYPSVLRMIKLTVEAAKDAGIPVGVCGEAASDPLMLPFLLGAGISGISVDPENVLNMRKAFFSLDLSEVKKYFTEVLKIKEEDEVLSYLRCIR